MFFKKLMVLSLMLSILLPALVGSCGTLRASTVTPLDQDSLIRTQKVIQQECDKIYAPATQLKQTKIFYGSLSKGLGCAFGLSVLGVLAGSTLTTGGFIYAASGAISRNGNALAQGVLGSAAGLIIVPVCGLAATSSGVFCLGSLLMRWIYSSRHQRAKQDARITCEKSTTLSNQITLHKQVVDQASNNDIAQLDERNDKVLLVALYDNSIKLGKRIGKNYNVDYSLALIKHIGSTEKNVLQQFRGKQDLKKARYTIEHVLKKPAPSNDFPIL